jgi:thymidine kinase
MIRQFVIGGRQVGKTHELLERMIDGDETYTYVAPTIHQAMDAYNRAVAMLEERGTSWDESVLRRFRERFKTWEQAADPMLGGHRHPVLIDDVEFMLEQLFGRVDTVTMGPPMHATIKSHHEGNPE